MGTRFLVICSQSLPFNLHNAKEPFNLPLFKATCHRALTYMGLQNVFQAILGNDHLWFLLFINLEFEYNISKYMDVETIGYLIISHLNHDPSLLCLSPCNPWKVRKMPGTHNRSNATCDIGSWRCWDFDRDIWNKLSLITKKLCLQYCLY